MRKLLLAAAVSLGLTSGASAAIVYQMQFSLVNSVYDGATGQIYDLGGPADLMGDAIAGILFTSVDTDTGIETLVDIGTAPTTGTLDFLFDVGVLYPGVNSTGTSQFFNVRFGTYELLLGPSDVSIEFSGTNGSALSFNNPTMVTSNLPFPIVFDPPVRFALSGQIFAPEINLDGSYSSFRVNGTGSAAEQIPEPAILSLLGIGLLGLGLTRRFKRRG